MALAPHAACHRAAIVAAVPPLDGMRAVPSRDHRRCAPLPHIRACCCCRLCRGFHPRSCTTTGALTRMCPSHQIWPRAFANKLDTIKKGKIPSALPSRVTPAWRALPRRAAARRDLRVTTTCPATI